MIDNFGADPSTAWSCKALNHEMCQAMPCHAMYLPDYYPSPPELPQIRTFCGDNEDMGPFYDATFDEKKQVIRGA
ncbi:unnamed protein product [Fusarium graminearum]|uniref:Chromosome 2, complete genome n=2 Tax=Gibberella zeae TaxID=5518 RepID=A0A098DJ82_GIBZE|nr:unnamed protein product [Fusarium graminearum]CAG1976923.1 unnamed protein product [Fusarium graminearum]CAG2009164.1 unnamed protein product [Fusarium graminearum]CAG2017083.1 unnamed protein product [Fusarium graminearum]CEF78006.1 unnamed protein product [Fusarium graminearum]